ncbi:hypothetical protein ACWCYY_31690 [Kitasatospora sp. NPDC001664]
MADKSVERGYDTRPLHTVFVATGGEPVVRAARGPSWCGEHVTAGVVLGAAVGGLGRRWTAEGVTRG